MMQEASWRKSWNPGSVMSMTTTALPGSGLSSRLAHSPGIVTSTEETLPTLAPAIRTSSPFTRKAPLSKMPRIS